MWVLGVPGLWALLGQSCCKESLWPYPAVSGRSPGLENSESWGIQMVGWSGRRGNMAKKKVRKVGLNQLVVLSCLAYIKKKTIFLSVWHTKHRPTLEGEPRIVGRGLRCISSLSLGEECKGRTAMSPAEGVPRGSECCFRIFCLPPPVAQSNRQGALWSLVPSPALCGCCWEFSLGSVCCRAAKWDRRTARQQVAMQHEVSDRPRKQQS